MGIFPDSTKKNTMKNTREENIRTIMDFVGSDIEWLDGWDGADEPISNFPRNQTSTIAGVCSTYLHYDNAYGDGQRMEWEYVPDHVVEAVVDIIIQM